MEYGQTEQIKRKRKEREIEREKERRKGTNIQQLGNLSELDTLSLLLQYKQSKTVVGRKT